ncbi:MULTISPECIES: SIR2 family protein [Methylotenera]|uniref:SIR2 family protein n=1 Tax=Methylotenera TaxID=359407 RepID=UPI0003790457|nr:MULTISPECIES: SIR2 family protein [Methylotenera]
MANIINLNDPEGDFLKSLTRCFQSGNLNFLLGSGASSPAISIAGNIELEIAKLQNSGEEKDALTTLYEFIRDLIIPNQSLATDTPMMIQDGEEEDQHKKRLKNLRNTLNNYTNFIGVIENILNERKTSLISKQANVFTSNYDLFFESAADRFQTIKLNDGFVRTCNLKCEYNYSPQSFFNSTFNTGNLYNYKVEIPAINLIKLHGSLTWKRSKSAITFSVGFPEPIIGLKTLSKLKEYLDNFSIILPQISKFKETIMDRTYYELLRLFANELDKENTFLIAFGFSFEDEHILEITRRALKNPTLKLMIIAYDQDAVQSYEEKFKGFYNVDIVAPLEGEVTSFDKLNQLMDSVTSVPVLTL